MREFSTHVAEALVNGLKPNQHIDRTMFFRDLYNLVPYHDSLRSYKPIQNVLSDITGTYPFPQWFRFERDNIALTDNAVRDLDDSFFPFDSSSAQTSDWSLGSFSEPFRGVDYGKDWILINGADGTIYKRGGVISSTTALRANAAIKHKNRTLLGGSPNGLWTADWITEFEAFLADADFDANEFTVALGSNFVLWSSFDSTDIPFGLIDPSEVFNVEGYGSRFLEALRGNELGFIEMPFSGDIYDMFALGEQVFIFGEDGIASMAMTGEASGAAYGITGSQPFGIKSRGAVGGDIASIVFIDNLNQLWIITPEGLDRLDFSEYMAELEGQIFITKDPDEPLFYIGDGTTSFVLNNGRLTRVFQTVSATSGAYAFRAGASHDDSDESARFETDKLDIGISSLKTLTGVHLGVSDPLIGTAQVTAQSKGKEYSSKKVSLNKENYAAPRTFGSGHRVLVELDSYEDIDMNRIRLNWQLDDRRQVRGIFSTEDASGTNQ